MGWMLCTVSKGLLWLQGLTGSVRILGRGEGGGRGMELHRKGHGLGFGIWGVLSFSTLSVWGFLGGSVIKNPPTNKGDTGSIPGSGRSPGEKKRQPTPVFLPGKSHGQRRLGVQSMVLTKLAMAEQAYTLEDGEGSDKRKRREVGFGEKRNRGRKGVCFEGEGNSFAV